MHFGTLLRGELKHKDYPKRPSVVIVVVNKERFMAKKSVSQGVFGGFVDLSQRQFIQVIVLGGVLGFISWGATVLFGQAIASSLFCGESVSCGGLGIVSSTVVQLLVGLVALLGLVRLSLYRPLFIVIGAVASLWGVASWSAGLEWYEGLIWSSLLSALTYLLFAWIVRPRKFAVAAVLVVLVVLAVRLLPLI